MKEEGAAAGTEGHDIGKRLTGGKKWVLATLSRFRLCLALTVVKILERIMHTAFGADNAVEHELTSMVKGVKIVICELWSAATAADLAGGPFRLLSHFWPDELPQQEMYDEIRRVVMTVEAGLFFRFRKVHLGPPHSLDEEYGPSPTREVMDNVAVKFLERKDCCDDYGWVQPIKGFLMKCHAPLRGGILNSAFQCWKVQHKGSNLTAERFHATQRHFAGTRDRQAKTFAEQACRMVTRGVQTLWNKEGLRDLEMPPQKTQAYYKAAMSEGSFTYSHEKHPGNPVLTYWSKHLTPDEKHVPRGDEALKRRKKELSLEFKALPEQEQDKYRRKQSTARVDRYIRGVGNYTTERKLKRKKPEPEPDVEHGAPPWNLADNHLQFPLRDVDIAEIIDKFRGPNTRAEFLKLCPCEKTADYVLNTYKGNPKRIAHAAIQYKLSIELNEAFMRSISTWTAFDEKLKSGEGSAFLQKSCMHLHWGICQHEDKDIYQSAVKFMKHLSVIVKTPAKGTRHRQTLMFYTATNACFVLECGGLLDSPVQTVYALLKVSALRKPDNSSLVYKKSDCVLPLNVEIDQLEIPHFGMAPRLLMHGHLTKMLASVRPLGDWLCQSVIVESICGEGSHKFVMTSEPGHLYYGMDTLHEAVEVEKAVEAKAAASTSEEKLNAFFDKFFKTRFMRKCGKEPDDYDTGACHDSAEEGEEEGGCGAHSFLMESLKLIDEKGEMKGQLSNSNSDSGSDAAPSAQSDTSNSSEKEDDSDSTEGDDDIADDPESDVRPDSAEVIGKKHLKSTCDKLLKTVLGDRYPWVRLKV